MTDKQVSKMLRMRDTEDALMGMIGCIRTMGQLDKLREAIKKHVEMFPDQYAE